MMVRYLIVLVYIFSNFVLCNADEPGTLEEKLNTFLEKYITDYTKISPRKIPTDIGRLNGTTSTWINNVVLRENMPRKYGNIEINRRIYIGAYEYRSNIELDDALSEWFRCFGTDCYKLRLLEETSGIKTPPVFAIINDDQIIMATTTCAEIWGGSLAAWTMNKLDIESSFSYGDYIVLDVGCGGPATWRKVNKPNKIMLTENYSAASPLHNFRRLWRYD